MTVTHGQEVVFSKMNSSRNSLQREDELVMRKLLVFFLFAIFSYIFKKEIPKGESLVNPDCQLCNPADTPKVLGLSLNVRNHCLDQVVAVLTANATGCGHKCDSDVIMGVAVGEEHSVFASSRVAGTYKLSMSRKVQPVVNTQSAIVVVSGDCV